VRKSRDPGWEKKTKSLEERESRNDARRKMLWRRVWRKPKRNKAFFDSGERTTLGACYAFSSKCRKEIRWKTEMLTKKQRVGDGKGAPVNSVGTSDRVSKAGRLGKCRNEVSVSDRGQNQVKG